jgi:hypothetical protein
MKRKLLFILLLASSLFITTCKEEDSPTASSGERIGAICNDGTTSTATGSGACSHHGGVKEWIYK